MTPFETTVFAIILILIVAVLGTILMITIDPEFDEIDEFDYDEDLFDIEDIFYWHN